MYDERKEHLASTHPDWPAKRTHLAAVRATVKRFLADLWVAWHEAEEAAAAEQGAPARAVQQ
jgi:hypothetical protein